MKSAAGKATIDKGPFAEVRLLGVRDLNSVSDPGGIGGRAGGDGPGLKIIDFGPNPTPYSIGPI